VQFLVWALCGASGALVLLAAFALGPLAVVPAGALALLATRLGGSNVSSIGSVAGLSAWAIVLGWPGRDGGSWPLFVAGCLLVLGVASLFALLRRQSAPISHA
jgi:hypothetical protein